MLAPARNPAPNGEKFGFYQSLPDSYWEYELDPSELQEAAYLENLAIEKRRYVNWMEFEVHLREASETECLSEKTRYLSEFRDIGIVKKENPEWTDIFKLHTRSLYVRVDTSELWGIPIPNTVPEANFRERAERRGCLLCGVIFGERKRSPRSLEKGFHAKYSFVHTA